MKAALRSVRRAFPYVRPYWLLGVLSVVVMAISTLISLAEPWPLALLIDGVLGKGPLPEFITRYLGQDKLVLIPFAVGAGFLINLASNSLNVANDYLQTKLDQKMVLDFRSDLFQHAQRLSLAFHDQRKTGELMNRINSQASAVGSVIVAIPPLVQSVLTLGGMFFIAYRLDSQLALVSLAVVPFIYFSTGFYAKRIEPRLLQVRGMEGESLSIVHEAMAMLRVIVAFGRETHEYSRFRKQGEEAVDARVKLTVRQTLFSLAVNGTTAAGTALVLGFGAYHVLEGRLTIGRLLIIMSYIAAVYQPLEQISSTVSYLQEQIVSLRGALELLDTKREVQDAIDARPIDVKGKVRFENVSFTYQHRQNTLKNISFEAFPGQVVAIVGPTGAGKTTLISLITRFYDPREGRVLLDGTDLREIKLESLRNQVSIVLQEPLLFSGTISDNIRYGKLDATPEEVEAAAQSANAHDFISKLPKGYETEIGERGSRLSVGERQRICVARAFMKDSPILILDEPTSSIDSRTEAVILDALDRLMEGRTTFVIAHRLSTVRNADQILVLNNGTLVEQGTRLSLMRKRGLYRQLYDIQTRSVRQVPSVKEAVKAFPVPKTERDLSNGKAVTPARKVAKGKVAHKDRSATDGSGKRTTKPTRVTETASKQSKTLLRKPVIASAASEKKAPKVRSKTVSSVPSGTTPNLPLRATEPPKSKTSTKTPPSPKDEAGDVSVLEVRRSSGNGKRKGTGSEPSPSEPSPSEPSRSKPLLDAGLAPAPSVGGDSSELPN